MWRRHLYLGPALLLFVGGSVLAQTQTYTTDPFRDLPPTSSRPDDPSAPQLAFTLEAEIPLPGPLPGLSPRLLGNEVEIPVAGGTVVTRLDADATPLPVAPPADGYPAPEPEAWVEDESGRRRYRATLGGKIEAQRRCRRCASGWKKRWKLRVAGNTLAPPLVGNNQVCFGALDNRVYCVKARNGHRLWLADLGARVSSPLVRWTGPAEEPLDGTPASSPERYSLILAVPDGGSELIALDSISGLRIAAVRLGDGEGKIVNGPLATADGRIVVARQKYTETEASLMIYRLRPVSPEPVDADAVAPESDGASKI